MQTQALQLGLSHNKFLTTHSTLSTFKTFFYMSEVPLSSQSASWDLGPHSLGLAK
jgi:hypothetical protein